MAGGIKT